MIVQEILPAVEADSAYQHARLQGDRQNARIEHDRALRAQILATLSDTTQLYQLFSDVADFQRWLSDASFSQTYQPPRQSSLPG